jgi:hypothetical protein
MKRKTEHCNFTLSWVFRVTWALHFSLLYPEGRDSSFPKCCLPISLMLPGAINSVYQYNHADTRQIITQLFLSLIRTTSTWFGYVNNAEAHYRHPESNILHVTHWTIRPSHRRVPNDMSSGPYQPLKSLFIITNKPKYSQHSILKDPQPAFLRQCQRPSFTPTQNNRQNYSSEYLNL